MARQRRLEVVIAGDAKGLEDAIDRAGGVVGGFGSKLGGFAKGAIASVGAAFAVDKVVDFGGQLLGLGSRLSAIQTKVATVFESQTAAIKQWADQNHAAFGLTDDELEGLAANFGDLLKPMGFTADQAAGMSKDVVGLAGALSAWTGGQQSASEVAEILASAMLGERDALKSLGINISEADVQARLAAKGQDELTGAALEQAKAVATQELIFEKSVDAQKAWAAGGNEALSASNRLKAGFGELKERLATGLVPVILTLVGVFQRNVMPVLDEVVGGVVAFVATFRSAEDGVTSSGFAGFMERLAIRARAAFDSISAKVREWWPTIQAIFQAVVAWVQEHWPEIQRITEETLAKVQETWASAFGAVRAIVETVVKVVSEMWDRFGHQLVDRLIGIAKGVIEIVQGLYGILTGIFDLIKAILTGKWGEAWEAIKQILAGAWQAIGGIVDVAWQLLLGTIQFALAAISAVWSLAWNAASTLLSDIWAGITATVSGGVEAIVGFIIGLPGRIADIGSTMWQGLGSGLIAVINWIIDQLNKIHFTVPSWVPGLGGKSFGFDIDHVGGTPLALGGGAGAVRRFHTGGEVPGRLGEEVLVMARAGERFSTDPVSPFSRPARDRGRDRGPLVGTMIVQGSDADRTARAVVDELTWAFRVAG